jgi:hypothetical protein
MLRDRRKPATKRLFKVGRQIFNSSNSESSGFRTFEYSRESLKLALKKIFIPVCVAIPLQTSEAGNEIAQKEAARTQFLKGASKIVV